MIKQTANRGAHCSDVVDVQRAAVQPDKYPSAEPTAVVYDNMYTLHW
jgi:hypothetical protein